MNTASLTHQLRLFWRIRSMATAALWAFKLRSIFVIIAISLGIASLTVIIAALDGANRKAEEMTEMFGPDAAFILGSDIENPALGKSWLTLSWDDVNRIRDSLPGAYLVVPMRSVRDKTAKYRNKNITLGRIIGATENYGQSWNWPLVEGRDITREDVNTGARIMLMGDTPATELFGTESPIGKTVFVSNIPFTVVGRLAYRGVAGGGGNLDDRVIIPLTTLTQRFGVNRQLFPAIRVKFSDVQNMDYHVANLESLLRDQHNLRAEDPNDFSILTAKEVQKFLTMIKGGLVAFLGITAAAALLVGGFVLANLFYLSVAERTTEIGLRKAMGARGGAIMLQFILESVALTLTGAVAGMFLGLAMGQALSQLGLIEIRLSWNVFFFALGASFAVGILFSLRPARRAASLDPIAALRGDA